MATSPYHVSYLLDKMSSVDKDFRFMATNDLMGELAKDSIKLDDDSERKVVHSVLKLVEDKNGEVQNLAVRCLGALVRKIKDGQVEVIINKLCSNMTSDDEKLRDISSVGLKTVISQLPHTSQHVSNAACRNITNQLLQSVSIPKLNQYVLLESLDILGDLIRRYGGVLSPYHDTLVHSLLPMLVDPRPVSVRKRSYLALCHLSVCCDQKLYNVMMTHLITGLTSEQTTPTSLANTRTFIQAIAAISRQSGQLIVSYLPSIVPLLNTFINSDDDELKESCLQAFECIVCFREVSGDIRKIISICLKLLAHDPNYNYDSDGDSDQEEMDTDDIDEEDDSYSDDDDVSWKVRRAAAKTLAAILGSWSELLEDFYRDVSPILISRFREREENVKCDIFLAYRSLLNLTKQCTSPHCDSTESMEMPNSPLSLLAGQVTPVVKALHKQLKDKSVKTRQGCFALLTDIIIILPGALQDVIDCLIPGIVYCLTDTSSSNMRIDTLVFLDVILTHHTPSALHPHIDAVIPPVIQAVDDSFYKITAEGLLVLQHIVAVIRPLDSESSFNYKLYADNIYSAAFRRLQAADIDQEVKERAITCMGQILANMGDHLKLELPVCLPVYVSRLRNEITRLTAVRAITMVTRSPLKIDISLMLADTIPLLASFLRKNHRDLRLATLVCVNQLLVSYPLSEELIEYIMAELPSLISDADLHISQHVLTLLCVVMDISPKSMASIHQSTLPNIMTLLLSSLLQGNALNAVADFFTHLVSLNLPGLSFTDIFQMLTLHAESSVTTPTTLHRQAYRSLSRCIAVVCAAVPDQTTPTVTKFLSDIKSESVGESLKLLALFSIGEIGKHNDLGHIPQLQPAIVELFTATSEEMRSAASYALGCVSAGNLSAFLPYLLCEVPASPKHHYLLLHSLKEVILCYNITGNYDQLRPHVLTIWEVLFQHFQSTEEGARNVVAECVGKLTLVDPDLLLPKLLESLRSESPYVRGTVVTALKYTISDQPHNIDTALHSCIGEFLSAIGDTDLNVRRVALVAFNSAAHNKPSLVRDLLDKILPKLYCETKVRKELIREVEMGPFKHTVDDGLDLRKAAFECMYTLLETCLDRLDVFEFLNHMEDGLRDHYDIKMLTFLLLVRLSHLRPAIVLQRVDKLIDPLRSTVQSRVKANSVKQEFEKQDEMKRSAMRAVAALLSIPDADKSPQLMEFLQQVKSNAESAALFESVQHDTHSTGGGGGAEPMDL